VREEREGCGDGKEYGSGRGVRHVDREKEAQ